MNRRRVTLTTIAGALAGIVPLGHAAADVTIGTGSRTGVYYEAGRALCRLIDEPCTAEPTAGSLANIEAVLGGEMAFGVVQSDVQYRVVEGELPDAGPAEPLRALFSLHGEPFTAVAREDAGIESFDAFEGKRVNIGDPGSGQRSTMETVMEAKGWSLETFELANELPAAEHGMALCHDRVQALVYVVGHPNESVEQMTSNCAARLVAVEGPAIDRLVDSHPYYVRAEIPGGVYEGNPEPVSSFGVTATLVTSAETDAELVYNVTKSVFEELEAFKSSHPAFAALEPGRMVKDGLTAPLHEGARRYYEEVGLLPGEKAAAGEDKASSMEEPAAAADQDAAPEPEDATEQEPAKAAAE